jgi:hypothetical protein
VASFTPSRFTYTERAPRTHQIGGWVGHRAGLDVVVKRKIPSHFRESNLRLSINNGFLNRQKHSFILPSLSPAICRFIVTESHLQLVHGWVICILIVLSSFYDTSLKIPLFFSLLVGWQGCKMYNFYYSFRIYKCLCQ